MDIRARNFPLPASPKQEARPNMLDDYSDSSTATGEDAGPGVAALYPHAPRAVRRALDYIHANLSGNPRLEDIAGAARMSVFHFSRTFRKATGTGPHRYLVRMRVERVKALLRTSDLSLAAIADETGFSDQSHMSKVFKKFTRMSPRTFRSERNVSGCPLQAWFKTMQGNEHAR